VEQRREPPPQPDPLERLARDVGTIKFILQLYLAATVIGIVLVAMQAGS
jgi:hypothetical protein